MRATIVIVGGLTVFQISAGLTIEKVAYLGVVLVATLFALQHIVSRWSCARALGAPSILFATGLVGLVVAVSPIAALQTGFTIEAWALDVPAYGMLVTAVILGLDLALSDHSPKHIATVVLLSGLVGAVGYASYFIGLRGIAEFGASRFVAVSTFLPAAAFCLALAYVFDGTPVIFHGSVGHPGERHHPIFRQPNRDPLYRADHRHCWGCPAAAIPRRGIDCGGCIRAGPGGWPSHTDGGPRST